MSNVGKIDNCHLWRILQKQQLFHFNTTPEGYVCVLGCIKLLRSFGRFTCEALVWKSNPTTWLFAPKNHPSELVKDNWPRCWAEQDEDKQESVCGCVLACWNFSHVRTCPKWHGTLTRAAKTTITKQCKSETGNQHCKMCRAFLHNYFSVSTFFISNILPKYFASLCIHLRW